MTTSFKKFKSDILGIFWVAAGLFLALSLATYHPLDPSLNSRATHADVKNACGYIGSFLADLLLQIWGLVAWVLVFVCVRLAWFHLRGMKVQLSWMRVLWAFLLMVVLSSLCALYFPEQKVFADHVAVGGLIGLLVSKTLVLAFNLAGVSLILWAALTMLVLFYTERSLRDLLGVPRLLWLWLSDRELHWPEWLRLPRLSFSMPRFLSRASLAGTGGGPEMMPFSPELTDTDRTEHSEPRWSLPSSSKAAAEAKESEDEDADSEEGRGLFGLFKSAPSEDENEVPGPKTKRRRVRLKTKVQRQVENWKLPDIGLLEDPPTSRYRVDEKEIRIKSHLLTDKLSQFSVSGEVTGIKPGPAVTMFEFKPRSDVKISKITDLADDLSLALSSESVRIIAPIPGRDVVGIETSNQHRETVYLKDILAHEEFWSDEIKLPIALGRQADGTPRVVDLRKMPHLLVAGTTGSGKSVFIVSILTGLLFRHSPKSLRVIMVDPKQVDLAAFANVPHLLMPVMFDAKQAVTSLRWAIREMEKRYKSMSRFGARGLESFNEIVEALSPEELEQHEQANQELEENGRPMEQYYYSPQPYIVIVVEEFGDLMAVDKGNVEQAVVRLAQMARACGIHLILAMQSPRKDVVTGLIKTNIPGRISFKVASKMDSRIILDDSGAERLLARGDMLFQAPGVAKPERHHGAWLTEAEINKVMEFWSRQGEPVFDELAVKALDRAGSGDIEPMGDFGDEGSGEEYDEKYDEIVAWLATTKEVSASLLQRRFRLGYPRAARMIEILEREGVIGPANGSKPREVLIKPFHQD